MCHFHVISKEAINSAISLQHVVTRTEAGYGYSYAWE